ncbi:MAG: DegT/DnrJ/EryC1/StrS family aminotransferase [Tannerella sp.]|jgi:dTDP-4-amino-4,6-dideoxygalactose transaminase|nr:DegT/DnrJ/EryC1/StrS family aminotransferase [Tannerella sp.]
MTHENDIHVTQPTLAPLAELHPLLEQIWKSGILTHNGPLVRQFEKDAARSLGITNLVATASGTIALQMGIKALNLTGEIITTPFTFVATTSAILWQNCTPVFADIDPDTFNIDPDSIEARITNRTSAIMPVHIFGNPCAVQAIAQIARRHHLHVLYDAAHAAGVQYAGRSILEYGDMSATSFHATKILNTVEGGGCVTTDRELHERLKRMRFYGYDDSRHMIDHGFNGKMTEVHAAVGIANLKYLRKTLDDRKEKYALYKEILSTHGDLKFQKISRDCNCCYFPVVFPDETTLLKIVQALNEQHVFPRRYFHPPVNTFPGMAPSRFHTPKSDNLAKRILCLPLYLKLEKDKIEHIATRILHFL